MWDILEQIWELPWYKVLVVAVADDVILFLKLWPVYLTIFGVGVVSVIGYFVYKWHKSKKRKITFKE